MQNQYQSVEYDQNDLGSAVCMDPSVQILGDFIVPVAIESIFIKYLFYH